MTMFSHSRRFFYLPGSLSLLVSTLFLPYMYVIASVPIIPSADQPEHLRSHYRDVADNHLKECLPKTDQKSCESSSVCTWCQAPGRADTGLCFPTMYASVAQCDQWDDMDTQCLLAGLPDDDQDPKDLCSKATDGEGRACIWCDVAFGAGVCMDGTQAMAAGR
mmetsp:Transcript_18232/g.39454  ORF Transcript_18232/g.39454 Transcript_18232/m.39454 type:complete len:163 (-) Transcript_18232:199-687(-)